ncbi:MAG TPA: hypothetical protein PLN81_08440 [Bacillota bacterium]|nr:hypothetical protein [Bacillota bacterium]
MLDDGVRITVTAKSRIYKFHKGQNPETDKPFEVVEKVHVLEGEEAERLLREQGIDPEEVKRRGRLLTPEELKSMKHHKGGMKNAAY